MCHPTRDYHGACKCADSDGGIGLGDPFTGGAYLQGTTAEGSCGADALQRFWPTLSESHYSGFDCHADYYTFRPGDAEVFYKATFEGLYRDFAGNADVLVPTPPCGEYVKERVGFDSANKLHYVCSESLMRNGSEVAAYVDRLAAVLADGRAVVTTVHPNGTDTDFIVLDAAGRELSRLSTKPALEGAVTLAVDAATVAGDRAYFAVLHTSFDAAREIVAYRLTETNEWQFMRRVSVDSFGDWQLVISDGTIFVRDNDPRSNGEPRIRAFLIDDTVHTVWREGQATAVREHIGDQLLIGPREPHGPSVRPR